MEEMHKVCEGAFLPLPSHLAQQELAHKLTKKNFETRCAEDGRWVISWKEFYVSTALDILNSGSFLTLESIWKNTELLEALHEF